MRKAVVGSILILLLSVLAVGVPAGANNLPLTGSPVGGLLQCVASPCTSTSSAKQPFFERGGFAGEPKSDLVNPLHRFELEVDGKRVQGTTELNLVSDPNSKWYVFNFRFGMSGIHSFRGCWYATDGSLLMCGTRTVTFG